MLTRLSMVSAATTTTTTTTNLDYYEQEQITRAWESVDRTAQDSEHEILTLLTQIRDELDRQWKALEYRDQQQRQQQQDLAELHSSSAGRIMEHQEPPTVLHPAATVAPPSPLPHPTSATTDTIIHAAPSQQQPPSPLGTDKAGYHYDDDDNHARIARAWNQVQENMNSNDAVMLQILTDIRMACQHMLQQAATIATQTKAVAPQMIHSGVQQQQQQPQPQQAVVVKNEIKDMKKSWKEVVDLMQQQQQQQSVMQPPMNADSTVNTHTHFTATTTSSDQIMAQAQAWQLVDQSISGPYNAEIYSLLCDIRDSWKQLVAIPNGLSLLVSSKTTIAQAANKNSDSNHNNHINLGVAPPSVGMMESAIHDTPTVSYSASASATSRINQSSFAAATPSTATTPISTTSDYRDNNDAIAQAWNQVDKTMMTYDDLILSKLKTIRDSWMKLADFVAVVPPASSSFTISNEGTTTKIPMATLDKPASFMKMPPPPVVPPREPPTQISQQAMSSSPPPQQKTPRNEQVIWQQSEAQAQAQARAWNRVDQNMVQNDDRILAALYELRDSWKRIQDRASSSLSFTSGPAETVVEPSLPISSMQSAPAFAADFSLPLADSTTPSIPTVSTLPIPATANIGTQEKVTPTDVLREQSGTQAEIAHAWERVDENMSSNDDKILSVLLEIRDSWKKMAESKNMKQTTPMVIAAAAPPPTDTRAFERSNDMSSEMPPPPIFAAEECPQSATKTTTIITSPPLMEARPTNSVSGEELNRHIADAWDNVNRNMVTKDETIIAILNDMCDSWKQLAQHKDGEVTAQEGAPKIAPSPQVMDVQSPQPPRLQDATQHLAPLPQLEEASSYSPPDNGATINYYLEQAQAWSRMDTSMAANDAKILVALKEIRDSWKNLAEAKSRAKSKPTATAQPERPQDISVPSTTVPLYQQRMESPPQVLPASPPQMTYSSAPVDSISIQQSYTSQEFNTQVANAWNRMDRNMVQNDRSILSVLNEIKESWDQIVDKMEAQEDLGPGEIRSSSYPSTSQTMQSALVFDTPPASVQAMEPPEVPPYVSTAPAAAVGSEAQAWGSINEDGTAYDGRILTELNELRESWETLRDIEASRPGRQPADLGLPPTPKVADFSSDFGKERLAFDQRIAMEPSIDQRIADAWNAINVIMSKNDETVLEVLQELSASWKRLAVLKESAVSSAPSESIDNHGPAPVGFAQTEMQAQPRLKVDRQTPQDQLNQQIAEARPLAHRTVKMQSTREISPAQNIPEITRAWSDLDSNMSNNDQKILSLLHEISDSWQRILAADAKKSQSFKSCPPQEVHPAFSPTKEVPAEPTFCAPRLDQQSMQAPVKPRQQPSSPEIKPAGSLAKSEPFIESREKEAAAWHAVDSTMNRNDEQILMLLGQIKDSWQALIKAEKQNMRQEPTIIPAPKTYAVVPPKPQPFEPTKLSFSSGLPGATLDPPINAASKEAVGSFALQADADSSGVRSEVYLPPSSFSTSEALASSFGQVSTGLENEPAQSDEPIDEPVSDQVVVKALKTVQSTRMKKDEEILTLLQEIKDNWSIIARNQQVQKERELQEQQFLVDNMPQSFGEASPVELGRQQEPLIGEALAQSSGAFSTDSSSTASQRPKLEDLILDPKKLLVEEERRPFTMADLDFVDDEVEKRKKPWDYDPTTAVVTFLVSSAIGIALPIQLLLDNHVFEEAEGVQRSFNTERVVDSLSLKAREAEELWKSLSDSAKQAPKAQEIWGTLSNQIEKTKETTFPDLKGIPNTLELWGGIKSRIREAFVPPSFEEAALKELEDLSKVKKAPRTGFQKQPTTSSSSQPAVVDEGDILREVKPSAEGVTVSEQSTVQPANDAYANTPPILMDQSMEMTAPELTIEERMPLNSGQQLTGKPYTAGSSSMVAETFPESFSTSRTLVDASSFIPETELSPTAFSTPDRNGPVAGTTSSIAEDKTTVASIDSLPLSRASTRSFSSSSSASAYYYFDGLADEMDVIGGAANDKVTWTQRQPQEAPEPGNVQEDPAPSSSVHLSEAGEFLDYDTPSLF